mmetsp:Transcript_21411/g.33798  ORF Transcript_21411/g.33798 Transcript_21411/m.33798 type:complete len:251 (+) Transcript_21411:1915-2667(+)
MHGLALAALVLNFNPQGLSAHEELHILQFLGLHLALQVGQVVRLLAEKAPMPGDLLFVVINVELHLVTLRGLLCNLRLEGLNLLEEREGLFLLLGPFSAEDVCLGPDTVGLVEVLTENTSLLQLVSVQVFNLHLELLNLVQVKLPGLVLLHRVLVLQLDLLCAVTQLSVEVLYHGSGCVLTALDDVLQIPFLISLVVPAALELVVHNLHLQHLCFHLLLHLVLLHLQLLALGLHLEDVLVLFLQRPTQVY